MTSERVRINCFFSVEQYNYLKTVSSALGISVPAYLKMVVNVAMLNQDNMNKAMTTAINTADLSQVKEVTEQMTMQMKA